MPAARRSARLHKDGYTFIGKAVTVRQRRIRPFSSVQGQAAADEDGDVEVFTLVQGGFAFIEAALAEGK
jgi:hypothetical protein